jgi:hypothetical protein
MERNHERPVMQNFFIECVAARPDKYFSRRRNNRDKSTVAPMAGDDVDGRSLVSP